MANGINNKYEYRSGLLDSLNVQHTASDVRNEDEYRKKVLNGLGVEYTEDDINQKNLYRAKVVEGLASSGGGGGGGGDYSYRIANVTVRNSTGTSYTIYLPHLLGDFEEDEQAECQGIGFDGTILYEGGREYLKVPICGEYGLMGKVSVISPDASISVTEGDAELQGDVIYITGDCELTLSV